MLVKFVENALGETGNTVLNIKRDTQALEYEKVNLKSYSRGLKNMFQPNLGLRPGSFRPLVAMLTTVCVPHPQVGSFFMINLCLVVIATQFSETKQREHQLMQEQRARCSSMSTLASEPGDCYEALFQLVCHILRKFRRQTVSLFYTLRGKPRGFRGVRRGRVSEDARERRVNGRGGREKRHVSKQGTWYFYGCHNLKRYHSKRVVSVFCLSGCLPKAYLHTYRLIHNANTKSIFDYNVTTIKQYLSI